MRPLGATLIVPNQCQRLAPGASLLTWIGALQVVPPSVDRTNITSSGSVPKRLTLARTYTKPRVGLPGGERSTSIQTWPTPPPGLGPEPPEEPGTPPRFTLTPVNVGIAE